ncbi:MAG TPA: lipoprotein LpqH [Mycobacterium sp.]|nr:lipoprotein LpqH [Mycobacterium sp.]
MEGTPFGRYRLIELLGRGGMGEVWRAYDTATNNRTVAIKLLPPNLAQDDTFVERFRREADAAARLNNPHIIPIHTYGEIDGRLYVDMRLIEGRDLQHVLADGPMEPGRAVRIVEQVAKALHAAHKIGLVHRDVKPSNILVDEDDFAYLIDFGIARGVDQTGLTGTGTMIGSWHYMAPERLRAHEADARADIYALTCVLYECLTGSRPFPGETLESQVAAHLTDPPPQPSTSQPNIPKQVDQVIATGMAKEPGQRYATTVELANAAHDAITTPLAQPSEPILLAEQPPLAPGPLLVDDRLRPMRPPALNAAWQLPANPHPAAPQQRPPGWPSVPPARPADWPPPQIGTPPPWGHQPRQQLILPLIAATIVILVAAAGITVYLLWPHSPASETPTAQSAPPSRQTAQPAPPSRQTASATSRASTTAGSGQAKVLIDGQDQGFTGQPFCTTSGGQVNISLGQGGNGYAVTMSDANPPQVKSVGLAQVNGLDLAYTAGMGQGSAVATKNGNSYNITGTATGIDTSAGMQMVTKPFEIDVTCP